ncbi:MAG: VIT domain-containing protein [Planctomycetota bacterium]
MNERLAILSESELAECERESPEGFGSLTTSQGPLPLKALEVRGGITGLVYRLSMQQTFVNTHDAPLEATYIFPLPDRAAVSSFRMRIKDRVIEGVLKERAEARRDYDQAIRDGHRAAIGEEERPDIFTMRVGNIPPGEQAQVELELDGALALAAGEATFRFPLVVAPRYIPGRALDGDTVGDGVASDTDQVPDASRISPPVLLPGFPNPVQLQIELTIDAAHLPVSDLRSSLHTVVIESEGERSTIRLTPGERLNRDFILRFKVASEAITSTALLVPDSSAGGGDPRDGTFLLTVVPPTVKDQGVKARDVVFVLDRSGSMEGWKIVSARRALTRMIDTLSEHDRFSVLLFDHEILYAAGCEGGKLIPATDRNRFRTTELLARIEARGGTEMAAPLTQCATMLAASPAERERILVLVTDGQVGNEDAILRALEPHLRGVRVFALGIDRAVNAGFLQRLAIFGQGHCELVESEDRLDEVMQAVHRRIATPLLTDLAISGHAITLEPETQTPHHLPGLFEGSPLFVMGRYRDGTGDAFGITARTPTGEPWSLTVPAQRGTSGAITRLWARSHIRDLEDRYAATGGGGELARRITDISLRYQVLSRFTALVAIDRSEVVNRGGEQHRVTQPVEIPQGWAGPQEPMVACAGAPMEEVDETLAGAMEFQGRRPTGAIHRALVHLGRLSSGPAQTPTSRCRLEARHLLRLLRKAAQAGTAKLLQAWSRLRDKLHELESALRRAGLASEAENLSKLLDEFEMKLPRDPGTQPEDEIVAVWKRLEDLLASIAREPDGPDSRRRKAFWA